MKAKHVFTPMLAALFVSLMAVSAHGQSNVGQISGAVYDEAGKGIPGATVSATNAQTGLKQTATSDGAGLYVFPALAAGTYSVRAEQQGFRASEQAGVNLDAASRRSIDFKLVVGQVSESVSVTAQSDQVQTTSGEVSRTITGTQVNQIALNGRNYAQLVQLVPGAVGLNSNALNLGLSTTGQRINGVRTNSIYFTYDGVDNMDNGGNSNAIVNPSLDTIAEIKILTASYNAEFGGRAGAQVNVVSKGGTREFHGTVFEFIRNDALDARSFFAAGKEPLRFNNFGWTFGGPIFIPRRFSADRSKWFFFAGQEWKYNRRGLTQLSTVPTAEERAGDFRNSTLTAPVDPLTSATFPNRTVPSSRFSKNGPGLLKAYPLPNFGGPGGNFRAVGVSRTDTRQDHLRVDYNQSPKTQWMYRYTHDEWDIFDSFQGGNLGNVPGGRPRPGWTTVLSHSYAFSPTLLNYASFSGTANQIQGTPQNDALKRSALGLDYPEVFGINAFNVGPNVSIAGFTGYNVGDRIITRNTTFQFRDDLSKVIGSHALKFGAQLTRSRKNQNSIVIDNGSVTFNTSARNTTCNVIADVLLGNFQNYTEGRLDTLWFARFNQLEFYAQDSWRVNRRLSLDFGLRYNIVAPTYSSLGNFTTFVPERYDPAKAAVVDRASGAITTTGDPYNGIVIFGDKFPDAAKGRVIEADDPSLARLFVGLSRTGSPTNYKDFGPRLGFAYDATGDGKTAVRGGFGIFYDRGRSDALGNSSSNPPFGASANIFDGNIDNPAGGAARRFPQNLSAPPLDQPTPMVMSYNLGVQRELPGNVILDVAYVGTLGRHLIRNVNINQLREGARLNPPDSAANVNALRRYLGYANITTGENADNSNYNSLQVSANRRIQKGLFFSVNYTFSRTLDTTSGTPQDTYNMRADYGLSDIHRTHVFNINYVYELPFFHKTTNAYLKNALGGWELAGITTYQSGAPVTLNAPVDAARIGASSTRATLIADPNLSAGERTLERWFNTEAALAPEKMTAGRFGTGGRNVLIGPGFNQWDVSLSKNFYFRERARVQFRAEAFNFVNHASFTGVNTTVRFDAAGKPSQNYGAVNGAGPGRVLEFGLKVIF